MGNVARERGAARVVIEPDGNVRLRRRPPRRSSAATCEAVDVQLPGRLEWRGDARSGTAPTRPRRSATSRPACRRSAPSSRRSCATRTSDGDAAPTRRPARTRSSPPNPRNRAALSARGARRACAAVLRARVRSSPTRRPRSSEAHELGEPRARHRIPLSAGRPRPPSAEPTYHGHTTEKLSVFAARRDRRRRRSWRSRSASATSSARSSSRASAGNRRRSGNRLDASLQATTTTKRRRPVPGRPRLLRLGLLARRPERRPSSSASRSGWRSRTGCTRTRRRRIEDPWLIAVAVALGVFPPFLGPLIYMLFRPPEYLEDIRERELEIRAMEERSARGAVPGLPRRASIDASSSCPVCTTKLKQACRHCNGSRSSRSGRSAPTARRRSSSRRSPATLTSRSTQPGPVEATESAPVVGADARPDQARRGPARPCRAHPRPFRAARPDDPSGEAADGRPRARRRHYAEHAREAVLRRARRLHHSVADARARAGGRGRDRRRPDDDGRDEPVDAAPGTDPRRLRAVDAGQPRARLGLAGVG